MRKLLSVCTILCVMVMLLCYAGTPAQATEIVAQGECGDSATWTLDQDGNMTITGTGLVWRGWGLYKDDIKTVTFCEGITQIGMEVFWDYSNLTSVSIPSTLTFIDEYAFHHCRNLSTVYISDMDAWNNIRFVSESSNPTCYGATLIMLSEDDSAASMQRVEFTVDTLGLEAQKYSAGTTTVDGVAVEWVQLGNYGDGIQMRAEDGITSMLWNTTPVPGGITKIRFTYSATKSVLESESMIVSFGNEVKGADYDDALVTFDGATSYSIIPDRTDYTFFCIEWIAGRTSYWDSIEVYYYVDDEHPHSYRPVITAPTCTADGYTTYTCTACGDSYISDTVPAVGHNYGYWYLEKEATCAQNGAIARICKNCQAKETDILASTNHSYTTEVIAPTCTEKGYTLHSCSECGDSYCDNYLDATDHSFGEWIIDTYPTCETKGALHRECAYCDAEETGAAAAIGHNFSDGICTRCGKLEITPRLSMKYPSLSFEDEIFYNVYYTVDDTSSIVEMGLITFDSKLTDVTIADAVDVIPGYVFGEDMYMVRTNGIPAKNLGDALYFKVYAKLSDGNYVYSDVAGYHAVAYANTVLNNAGSSAEAKALVVAMLNYGASAQEYFGHKTEALMNAGLTAEQQALVMPYDASMLQTVNRVHSTKAGYFLTNGGFSAFWPTVSFEGTFSINFYITPDKTLEEAPVLYYWDEAKFNSVDELVPGNHTGRIVMSQDGSEWCASIEGIAAKAIDEPVYVACLYTSNGVVYRTTAIAYSLGTYCKTLANSGNAFGAATAVYGYYAKAYFS